MVQISTLLSIVASVSAASATTRHHPSIGALAARDAQQGSVAEIYRRLLDSRTELQVREKIVEVPEHDLQEILTRLAELQDDVEGLLAKAGKANDPAVEVNSDEKPQGKGLLEGNGENADLKAKDALPGLKNTNNESGTTPAGLKNLKSMGEVDEASNSFNENTSKSKSKSLKGTSNDSSDAGSSGDKSNEDDEDSTSTITLTSTSTKRVTVTAANMHTVTATSESQATDGPDADADADVDEDDEDEVDTAPFMKVAIEDGPEGEEVNSKAVLESAHIPPASTDTPTSGNEDDAGFDDENEDDTSLPAGPKAKAVDTSSGTGSQPRQTSTSSSTTTGDAPPVAVTDTAPSSNPSVPETPSTLATSPEEIATPAPGSSSSTNGAAPLIDVNLKNVASSTTDSPDRPAQVSSSPTSDSNVKTESEEETDMDTTTMATESDDAKSSEPDVVRVPSDTGSEAEATPGKQTSTGFKTLIRF